MKIQVNRNNSRLYFFLAVALVVLFSGRKAYCQVSMVTDLNKTGVETRTPKEFMVYNDKLYFQAKSEAYGKELWVYDGQTTKMVVDINPGVNSSDPQGLTVFNNKLYFYCNDGVHDYELWVYDGVNKPNLVIDINNWLSHNEQSLIKPIVYKEKLYFNADDGIHGGELWVYDGNQASLAIDTNPGRASSGPRDFNIVNDTLYFLAYAGGNENTLYKYTGEGNPIVENTLAGISASHDLYYFKEKFYFSGSADGTGGELWKYESGSSPELVKDINPGSSNSFPSSFLTINNYMYFVSDIGYNSYIWRYDGDSDPEKILDNIGLSEFDNLFAYKDRLFFTAVDDNTTYLWNYDLTSGNLQKVQTWHPNLEDGAHAVFRGNLFFSEANGHLWMYDGLNSPRIAANLIEKTNSSYIHDLIKYNDKIYFIGVDGERSYGIYDSKSALWEYKEGEIPKIVEATYFIDVRHYTVFKNKLYIVGLYSKTEYGLFIYDGVNKELQHVSELDKFVYIDDFLVFKDQLYFIGSNHQTGPELWALDEGRIPRLVKDINPGTGASYPNNFTVYKDKLYFSAYEDVHGVELWQYDGLHEPTMLMDINPEYSAHPTGFAILNEKLYFSAIAEGDARFSPGDTLDFRDYPDLWVYDGQNPPQNTKAVSNYTAARPTLMCCGELTEFKGKLYFVATDSTYSTELFSYDGSMISLVRDLNPGTTFALIKSVFVYQDKLFFIGSDSTAGYELFVYDGISNPKVLTDFKTGREYFYELDPKILNGINNTLYFSADDGVHGSELWKIDNISELLANETSVTASYNIYPNPTTGLITISSAESFTNSQIIVRSILGQEIFSLRAANGRPHISFTLNSNPGIYIVTIINDKGKVSTFKLIKK